MGVGTRALESLGGLSVQQAFWKGKRVFVTGHTGFKGAWLCRILTGAGAEVTGYSLEPPTQPNFRYPSSVMDLMIRPTSSI